jgi:hypothetical protein
LLFFLRWRGRDFRTARAEPLSALYAHLAHLPT